MNNDKYIMISRYLVSVSKHIPWLGPGCERNSGGSLSEAGKNPKGVDVICTSKEMLKGVKKCK